jgi:hypothetical protein
MIEYFFAYKDLMNEDWDGVLGQFVQRFESAREFSGVPHRSCGDARSHARFAQRREESRAG